MALALPFGPALAQSKVSPAAPFITQQPSGDWLASQFMGQPVTNQAGETVGDINDLRFDKSGRVTIAVLGVGGFLGMGEKNVAVPFGSLVFSAGKAGERVVMVPLSKQALQQASSFLPTEKSSYTKMKEKAGDLKDRAVEKIDSMTSKDAPTSK